MENKQESRIILPIVALVLSLAPLILFALYSMDITPPGIVLILAVLSPIAAPVLAIVSMCLFKSKVSKILSVIALVLSVIVFSVTIFVAVPIAILNSM
jgi:hypothetical protein